MKKNKITLGLTAFLLIIATSAMLLGGCGKSDSSAQEAADSTSESSAVESTAPESPEPKNEEAKSTEPEKTEPESAKPESAEPEDTKEEEPELSPAEKAELSERAMQNFLDKILAGNYVMNAEGFSKTTVASEDLVVFDYEDDELYSDFVVMSVNNEVFQGFLTDDGVSEVAFLKEGNALEMSKAKLPSYWLEDEVSGGNIFNIFYNDMDNPLMFVSNDAGVQNQLRSLVGYGQVALNYMHEVYMTLDAEDPSEVRLQAEVDDDEVARYYFDDIDITITFGDAEEDERAKAWMQDPDYPDARTAWTDGDIFIFNSIFLPGYGEQAIPFLPFASYALSIDEENFLTDNAVYIRDPHATNENIEDYIALLEENGFEEHTEDGETTYRHLLREETMCYSSIALEYNDGLNLTAKKAYDFPTYEGLDQINSVLGDLNLAALPETEVLTDFSAVDRKWEQTESWLYLYDYNAVLYVYARYEDEDQVMDYLDAYVEILKEDGFKSHYGEEAEAFGDDYYESPDQTTNFRYHFEDDGETVILLYKSEKLVEASEAQAILADAGFPGIDFTGYLPGRNTVKFQKTMYGREYDPSLSLTWKFDAAADAEAFLDQLVADLEEDDYYRVPPSQMNSNKENAYINEEKGMGVAFSFLPNEDNTETYIYFDFRGGIDFNAEYEYEDEDGGGSKPILGWKYADEAADI